jgi:GNAT superfamily N-acetyltransferase
MALGTWWQGDPIPVLPPLPTFSVQQSTRTQLIAQIAQIPAEEAERRLQTGHRLYLAYMHETPVAYGWLATQIGGIAELQHFFTIAAGNCYLWDFLTVAEWRGHGIYAQFLQAIMRQEMADSALTRFWIGYAPGNEAAKRGISKAGFQFIADFVVADSRAIGITPLAKHPKALECAIFFKLPVLDTSSI